MKCYINRVTTDRDVMTDIRQLIPDALLRRRMSRVIRNAVSTAVECVNGTEAIASLDAIITATGWGCLADSEAFLHNVITDGEQLLNPTPFIRSTFNTVGAQIALLGHNHCYNVTYVNRSHSFEDALLDALMQADDGESGNILVGAFDEQTLSQRRIMERMGAFASTDPGEGSVFVLLSPECTDNSVALLSCIDFPGRSLDENECLCNYASSSGAALLYNSFSGHGLFPVVSAFCFADAVRLVRNGAEQVIVYNEYLGASPAIMRIECIR